jgi:small subunit ribosomal protein S1
MAKSNKKEIASHGSADFDWEALSLDGYTQIQRSELSDKYEKTLTSINEKEVIQGTVEMITKKEVIVNIGYKSEGVVAANEFRYNPDLKVGDTVDVYVEVQEDKTGQLIVSHRTARMHSAWIRVNDVLRSGEIITGYVKCRTKGGLIVDVFGIEAFLPGSQIDVKQMLLFLIKRLLKLKLKSRKNKSSLVLKKDKYWKVLLKTSLHTVYSSTLVV